MMGVLMYDVCIVGAGVSGALLATKLIEAGLSVCMVDSGPRHPAPSDRYEYYWHQMAEYIPGPWTLEMDRFEHKYLFSGDISGAQVERAVGGSTLVWDGTAIRAHKSDFERLVVEGEEYSWPLSYQDLEPYYCEAEKMMGCSGANDVPWAPKSQLLPNPEFPFSYEDKKYFIPACEKLGIHVSHACVARNSRYYDGRSRCVQFKGCEACPVGAKYSADVHVNRLIGHPRFVLLDKHDAIRIEHTSSKATGLLIK